VNLRAYWRFLVVAWQFLPLLLSYARDRRRFLLFGRSRRVSSDRRRRRAEKLLDSMLTLGPTFIKLGQLLSTRPDVLPPEYLAEFTKLQDRVPPADWAEAEALIERELGPIEERFDSLDTEPISGASLGQVYEGSVDGQQVAVKVRRPGVRKLVEADLRVVRWSVPILAQFVDDVRSFSLETLADEFARTIREEMDYGREAEMLREIRGNFRDDDNVRIPSVLGTHSTERILTMEYVPGTKINNLNRLAELGIDRDALAERLQFLYLQMIIEDGVFHADPTRATWP
jgi:Predicted unusual protein kinase